MTYDRKVYRASHDAVGAPGDTAATDSTSDWTQVSLLKGLYAVLTGTGIVITGVSTAANQATGNATSAAILAKIIAAPATEAKQNDAITQETAINVVLGTTAGAAVVTSAAGTIQGYLRGIVSLLVSGIMVATHAVTQSGTWNVTVNAAIAAGTNLLGRTVADASAATGGIASTSRIVSAAASTNATIAKASAGRIYAIQGYNAAAAVRYLKLYNKASAPTVGTDTPVKTLAIPPGAGFAFDWPHGYSLATGIAYALTTGSADADTGALTLADVVGLNVDYV